MSSVKNLCQCQIGTQTSRFPFSRCIQMNKISSLPCRDRSRSEDDKTALFYINPFISWTGFVEVILILHVHGNHFKVKILTPHSLGNTLVFGATSGLVSNTGPYCVDVFHNYGRHAIIRQHPTEAFMHI